MVNTDSKVRGEKKQQIRRQLEHQVRRDVLAFVRWLHLYGLNFIQTADHLALCPRTLWAWQVRWKQHHCHSACRGRPARRAHRQLRNAVIALFELFGPGIGLPTLQEIFPDVARRELESLLYRYRNAYRKRSAILVHALTWTKVGTIWAMDFTEPPLPVDGVYQQILVVRDLSSGFQLLALPICQATAQATLDALLALFREHGAPLVIKSDNGSPFIADSTAQLLDRFGVLHLTSPPALPEYNGACEAGIGSIKTRAHHQAARNDRPAQWTCDDVETARLMANQTARPRGLHSPVPDTLWRLHPTVTQTQRDQLAQSVNHYRIQVRKELGCLPDMPLSIREEANVNRHAISRALISLGLLSIRRRRITLPIKSVFTARI